MLLNVKDLEGFRIGASDGPVGSAKDFYFDDDAWVIRYVVVDTGTWLGGREVLISPYSPTDQERSAVRPEVTAEPRRRSRYLQTLRAQSLLARAPGTCGCLK
jgi:hypothetical protein